MHDGLHLLTTAHVSFHRVTNVRHEPARRRSTVCQPMQPCNKYKNSSQKKRVKTVPNFHKRRKDGTQMVYSAEENHTMYYHGRRMRKKISQEFCWLRKALTQQKTECRRRKTKLHAVLICRSQDNLNASLEQRLFKFRAISMHVRFLHTHVLRFFCLPNQ